MWRKVSTIISILCIAVYGAALITGLVKLGSAVTEQRIIADKEFSALADTARNAGLLGFSGKDFEGELSVAIARALTLDAVIVTLPDGASFAAEKNGKHVIIANYTNTVFSFNTKQHFYRPVFSEQLNTGRPGTMTISAISPYFNASRLGGILRETLLLVLFAVMTAFVTLVLEILLFNKSFLSSKKAKDGESDEVDRLFDEIGGESKGSYLGLLQKLNEYLAVPAHKQPDEFSLLCVEWKFGSPPLAGGETTAKQVAEEAAVFFHNKNISAFRRGATGVFVLLPGFPLKRALDSTREFHGRILANTALKPAVTSLYIGLTVRAGRDADAERIVLEAEKALEKAMDDPATPIVAFKADPKKFKNLHKH
jgi:hypothetical protein